MDAANITVFVVLYQKPAKIHPLFKQAKYFTFNCRETKFMEEVVMGK